MLWWSAWVRGLGDPMNGDEEDDGGTRRTMATHKQMCDDEVSLKQHIISSALHDIPFFSMSILHAFISENVRGCAIAGSIGRSLFNWNGKRADRAIFCLLVGRRCDQGREIKRICKPGISTPLFCKKLSKIEKNTEKSLMGDLLRTPPKTYSKPI